MDKRTFLVLVMTVAAVSSFHLKPLVSQKGEGVRKEAGSLLQQARLERSL